MLLGAGGGDVSSEGTPASGRRGESAGGQINEDTASYGDNRSCLTMAAPATLKYGARAPLVSGLGKLVRKDTAVWLR